MNIKHKKDGVIQAIRSISDKDISAVNTLLSIDVEGNLIVESFRKLMEYNSEKISLDAGGRMISLYGSDIKILSFSRTQLQIEGIITKIEFSEV